VVEGEVGPREALVAIGAPSGQEGARAAAA